MVAKIAYARKEELEKVLKKHLEHNDQLDLGGVRYRMLTTNGYEYPLEKTAEILAKHTGASATDIVFRIASVEKKALEKELKVFGKDKAKAALVKAELEAHAEKTSSSRFWAKGVDA